MYVRIGQMAQALGVSPHLLKHYEKLGLIQPIKDKVSNYRYYDYSQIEKLLECIVYRNIGVSLNEICEMKQKYNLLLGSELVKKQITRIDEKTSELENIRIKAQELYRQYTEFDQKHNQWFIEQLEPMIFIPISDSMKLYDHSKIAEIKPGLVDLLPLVQQMKLWTKDGVVLYGVGGEKSLLERMKIFLGNDYIKVEAGRMLTIYQRTQKKEMKKEEVHSYLKQYSSEVNIENLELSHSICVKTDYHASKETYCMKYCFSFLS